MTCCFLALEGFTANALLAARAAGKLPSLDNLAAKGVLGELTFPLADARVAMLVSAMTGTWPDQHGILLARTVEPAGQTLRPSQAADRQEPAFWELLDNHALPGISVGWPLAITGQTNNTAIVSAGFGRTPTRDFQPDLSRLVHPANLASRLADCWLRPEELEAGMIAALAPQWRTVNQTVDQRLSLLGGVLAENVSRHAAFLELLDTHPAAMASLCLSLPGELASLERASQPLADDLFAGLGERALPLLNAFFTEIFNRLPVATHIVVAGLPHAETPAEPGFVLLSGPNVNPAACLQMASVLDLTPLVWQICGYHLPGLADPGLHGVFKTAPARQAFDHPQNPAPGQSPLNYATLTAVTEPLIEQPGEPLPPVELWRYQALGILGRSLLARQAWLGALPVLAASTRLAPNDQKAHLRLGACQQALGLLEEALDTTYACINPQLGSDPEPLLRAAELEALTGHPERARKLLEQAAPELAKAPQLRRLHADILIYLREWKAATGLWSALVAETPQNAYAQMRLARCHLAQSNWHAAFDCSLASARLYAPNARNYEILGHALLGMGWQEQAWKAFESATAINPAWPRPWAKLVLLARKMDKPEAEIARLTAHYQLVKDADHKQQAARKATARACLIG